MAEKSIVEEIKSLTYAESMAEIEGIVAELQREDCDIDRLAERTARAVALIEHCRHRLRRSESEVAQLLGEE